MSESTNTLQPFNETNRPIKIAHIIGKLVGGGIESVVYNYYKKIDKSKYQFDLLYDADSPFEPPEELLVEGARFIKVPPYQDVTTYVSELQKLFVKEQYNIVHSHINTLSIFPLFAAWKAKVPVRIAHNHSVPGGKEFKRNALKYFLKPWAKTFATDYFACSIKAGAWLFGKGNMDSGRVYIMKNAIDFSRFRVDTETRKNNKRELGLGDCFVIGNVGRLTPAKNHEKIISIFVHLKKMRKNSILVLVGDGTEKKKIEQMIEEANLNDFVLMIGNSYNPEKYYSVMDVSIVPSTFEGLSMATVESQVAGVPVIVSEAVPQEAIISDGCRKLSISDPDQVWVDTIIKEAGKTVHIDNRGEEYNIDIAVKKLEKEYDRLVEKRRAVETARGGYHAV